VPGSAKIHWGVARLKFIENKKQQGKNGIAPELNGSGAFLLLEQGGGWRSKQVGNGGKCEQKA